LDAGGLAADNDVVGTVYDVSPQLAILMIAAKWARLETRAMARRSLDMPQRLDRRRHADRRTASDD
jgi:hypothetical protein